MRRPLSIRLGLVTALAAIGFAGTADATLVGHYTFDEASGTVALDSTGGDGIYPNPAEPSDDDDGTYVNQATRAVLANAPAFATAGTLSGTVLDLEGSDDGVNLGANQNLIVNTSSATLAAWIYPTDITGTRNVIAISRGDNGGLLRAGIGIINNKLVGRARDGDAGTLQVKTSTPSLVANTWQHVAAEIDYANDTITLYINGQLVSSTGTITFANTATPNTPNASAWIGLINATNEEFVGQIDDARIYNESIGGAAIAALVPEPGALTLAAVAAAGLLTRRRRSVRA